MSLNVVRPKAIKRRGLYGKNVAVKGVSVLVSAAKFV